MGRALLTVGPPAAPDLVAIGVLGCPAAEVGGAGLRRAMFLVTRFLQVGASWIERPVLLDNAAPRGRVQGPTAVSSTHPATPAVAGEEEE